MILTLDKIHKSIQMRKEESLHGKSIILRLFYFSNSIKNITQTRIRATLAMKSGCFSVRLMRYDASAAENLAQSDRRKVCKQFARIFSVMTFQWQASRFMLNFFMEDRAHEFYWAHFIFDQPSLARTLRDCHYYQHLIILSSLNCPWLPFISFDNLSTLSQVLRLMHPH